MAPERLWTDTKHGWRTNRLRTLARRGRLMIDPPPGDGEVHRPAIFTLLFWLVLLAAIAAALLVPLDDWQRLGWLPLVVATVALVAVWQALPWDPGASWQQKLLVPAFLAVSLLFGYATVFLWGLAFYPIAVANAVFVFGFRRAVIFAIVGLPAAWLSVYAFDPGNMGIVGAIFMTALVVPMAIFMIGICKLVIDAEQSRQAAQALSRDLESANAELTRQAERVKTLAVAEERARIARDVHDSLGHHLTAINLQLQNAERFAARDPERSWQKVRDARSSTLLALAEVRRSVRALKPPAFDEQSGVAALTALARSFDGTGPEVSFRIRGDERPLTETAELVLYRVMQEGLTNAARHAGARLIAVTLTFEPGALRLTITDDGKGAPDGFLESGFGLPALRERVEGQGGSLVVGNQPGGGFSLVAILPIEAEPERSAR
jgi:signal transduction histidine kinase